MPDPAHVPFSPSLPDVTKKTASKMFQFPGHTILFVKDVLPLFVVPEVGIEYLYVMVVVNEKIREPIYIVTLEKSALHNHYALCDFDSNGSHGIYESTAELIGEKAFLTRALQMIEHKFNVETIEEKIEQRRGFWRSLFSS